MSSEYKLPTDDEEMVFYFPPDLIKRNNHSKSEALLYVRTILGKIINEYNINSNQSIGFVGDIDSVTNLMVNFIDGYMDYWFTNDIDFENPLPNKV
jgi:hypothetical protein